MYTHREAHTCLNRHMQMGLEQVGMHTHWSSHRADCSVCLQHPHHPSVLFFIFGGSRLQRNTSGCQFKDGVHLTCIFPAPPILFPSYSQPLHTDQLIWQPRVLQEWLGSPTSTPATPTDVTKSGKTTACKEPLSDSKQMMEVNDNLP